MKFTFFSPFIRFALIGAAILSLCPVAQASDGSGQNIFTLIDGPFANKRDAFTLRMSNVALSNPTQEYDKVVGQSCIFSLCGDVVEAVPVKFDDSSATVISIDYEHFNRAGWYSYGFELYRMETDYTASALSETRGKLETTSFLINTRFYLDLGEKIMPYAGVGLGYVGSKMSGAISAKSDGFVWKTMLGVHYQIDDFYLRAGYQRSDIGLDDQGASGNDGVDREIHVSSFLSYDGYFVAGGIRF